MKLHYLETLLPGMSIVNQGVSQVMLAIAWAPNSRKLAVCGRDRVVFIYDENGELKDKFPARPADGSTAPTSGAGGSASNDRELSGGRAKFKVLDMAFSPDSTKLATAQSDGMVHIYKMGEGFKEKKSILGKLAQPKSVTQVAWGSELEVICSLLDGKLRHTPMASIRSPKGRTFFDGGVPCVSLVCRHKGMDVGAGFADGKIALFTAGTGDVPNLKYTINHSCAPFALAFGGDTLLAGGSDKLITVYNDKGKPVQVFDYSKKGDGNDKEFSTAVSSPNEQFVLLGGMNRVRKFRYLVRRKMWEEAGFHDYPNLKIVMQLKWSEDGTRVALGNMYGALYLFEANMKKSEDDLFDVIYTTPSKIVIHVKSSNVHMDVQARDKVEILDVRVMGKEQYAIASTMETFIFCDLNRRLGSEVDWPDNDGNERFYFGNPNVCVVFNTGYFTLVEYGAETSLGSYRTELANPHVISVRINERLPERNSTNQANKKLAYLTDLRSITIVDLDFSHTIGHVAHDAKIDWLELNETGTKLLYRDTKLRLTLVDVDSLTRTRLVSNCSFVQWVPGSDVVVAQSHDKLCVWYNINHPEQVTNYEAKGIAFNVVKGHKKTYVQVSEAGHTVNSVHLDESLIEFGTAMEDGDLLRAVLFLEVGSELSDDMKAVMWKQLQKRAMELGDLAVFERAAAGCGDVAKTKYVRDTLSVARSAMDDDVEPQIIQNEVEARMALLRNETEVAETAFLQNEDTDSCISMYESIHKWQDALRLANASNNAILPQLTENFLTHLLQSGQEELAADFLELNGNYDAAIETFLNAGIHTKAAKLIRSHRHKMDVKPEWMDMITKGLLDSEFYPEAGEFLETMGKKKEALECYKKAKLFNKALSLAKDNFPHMVVDLEEEWGNEAFAARQFDEACARYIECGKNTKALSAAIEARHWERAMQIINVIEDPGGVVEEYEKLAQHFAKTGDFRQAEYCYGRVNQVQKLVDMYLEHELYEDAYRLAKANPSLKAEIERSFLSMAQQLQDTGKYKTAEKVLTSIGEINSVINMYVKKKMYEDMLRVVQKYHPSHVESSRRHVAELLRKEGHFRSAEAYFIKSGDYKEALGMYEANGQWEDAYRVARDFGGPETAKKVIYKWADALGGETGIMLLQRHNCINGCIEYLCEIKKFDYAYEVAKYASKEAQSKFHISFAKHFASLGDYKQACNHFLYAYSVQDAIDMYMSANMIDEAVEVAIEHGTREDVDKVLIMQAQVAFDQQNYRVFEAALLKCEKPEIAIRMYKDHGMWTEAFRLCKEYAPVLLQSLQNEYDASQDDGDGSGSRPGSQNVDQILQQAKDFEKIGEYKHSIDCYMRINTSNCPNEEFVVQCWGRAGQMAAKHLDPESRQVVVTRLALDLRGMGRYSEAASLCMNANMKREALDALMDGHLWDDAKRAARSMGPDMEQYVMQKHTLALQTTGSVDELSSVNLKAALELLSEKGEWDKCLEKARVNEEALNHYMGLYIRRLLQSDSTDKITSVYRVYGLPYTKSHMELFKQVASACFIQYELDEYERWLNLRNVLSPVLMKMEDRENDSPNHIEFKTLFFIIHLHVNRAACLNVNALDNIPVKISIALLRYTNIIPAEKYFFQAGHMCKKAGMVSMGYMFLNHYVDIREAIDGGRKDTRDMDYSAFVGTDIPHVVPLTAYPIIPQNMYLDTRDWAVTTAMDPNTDPVLQTNSRGDYVASLVSAHDGSSYQPCVISGYPVIEDKISFRKQGLYANKEDWNRFIVIAKGAKAPKVSEAYQFIIEWCGSNPNYNM